MDTGLAGQRAFVSGSTQGIGYAIARGLLREGVEVVVNGRSGARVAAAVSALRADHPGSTVSGLVADLGDAAEAARIGEQIRDVDILVNNVGRFGVADFTDLTDDDWATYLEVNLMSGVRLSRAALPAMLARGTGRILFVSSESGVNVPADMIHYGVSKAGMIALANGLAKLTRGTGVTVNTILGGPTYSEGVATAVQHVASLQGTEVEAMKAAIAAGNSTSLLARFLEPDEIAHLAVYLASPLASATNGAALRADGGVLTAML